MKLVLKVTTILLPSFERVYILNSSNLLTYRTQELNPFHRFDMGIMIQFLKSFQKVDAYKYFIYIVKKSLRANTFLFFFLKAKLNFKIK